MQIQNVQQTKNFTPNFQSIKTFKLPTREVLECATGRVSLETLENPKGILSIFSQIHSIPMKSLMDLHEVPLGFNIYTVSTGTMIKANNPEILKISQKIDEMPKSIQLQEIKNISNSIGNTLNVVIDDNIKTYSVIDGKISVGKSHK